MGKLLRHTSWLEEAIEISVEKDESIQGDHVVDVMHKNYVPPDDRIQEQ